LLRSDLSVEDQLQRQININMQLRRQLETARRDVIEYCAKFCEDLDVDDGKWYAGKLRGIIGR
jgi:Leu/Phe-tRNA-protein transferase